jgi:AAA15 family ATPase/GTPase
LVLDSVTSAPQSNNRITNIEDNITSIEEYIIDLSDNVTDLSDNRIKAIEDGCMGLALL